MGDNRGSKGITLQTVLGGLNRKFWEEENELWEKRKNVSVKINTTFVVL